MLKNDHINILRCLNNINQHNFFKEQIFKMATIKIVKNYILGDANEVNRKLLQKNEDMHELLKNLFLTEDRLKRQVAVLEEENRQLRAYITEAKGCINQGLKKLKALPKVF